MFLHCTGVHEVTLCKDANGRCGISLHPVNKGVFVCFIQRDSPAALSGLRFGDQILSVRLCVHVLIHLKPWFIIIWHKDYVMLCYIIQKSTQHKRCKNRNWVNFLVHIVHQQPGSQSNHIHVAQMQCVGYTSRLIYAWFTIWRSEWVS